MNVKSPGLKSKIKISSISSLDHLKYLYIRNGIYFRNTHHTKFRHQYKIYTWW